MMGKISRVKIIEDIARGYMEKTGEPSPTNGNVVEKVVAAIGSGGISDGNTVTFKVDDKDCYMISCLQGESITGPSTIEGKPISDWCDEDETVVSFPFTPETDIELTGTFLGPDLLLHCNDFTDSGDFELPITNNGVTIDTEDKKFGTGSFAFDNSYIDIPSDVFGSMRNSDFTIDFWVKIINLNTRACIMDIGQSNAANSWLRIEIEPVSSGGLLHISFRSGADYYDRYPIGYTVPLNEWTHIAVARKYGGTSNIYINGISVWSGSIGILSTAATPIRIGQRISDSTITLDGNIDEFRIFTGTCVWENDFTPPVKPY